MKMVLIYFLSFFIFPGTYAQDISTLLKAADQLERVPNERAALLKLKEVLHLQPSNIVVLNKCSELCSRIGKRQNNEKLRDNYYEAAKTYAIIALKINPVNAEANCVMAIALGRTSLAKSGKEKINNAREIKKYVDVALKYDSNNYKAWHVLGRWHYEISTLNIFERAAVKVLFGGLPQASIKESISAFEKARSLSAGFILNYFEMSKAYKKDEQDSRAISLINSMLLLPNQTEDDAVIKLEGRKLLKEWQ